MELLVFYLYLYLELLVFGFLLSLLPQSLGYGSKEVKSVPTKSLCKPHGSCMIMVATQI